MIFKRLAQLALAMLLTQSAAAALANTEGFEPLGQGTLRWFGLKIYDATLLRATASGKEKINPEKIFDQSFALELTYARKLYGQAIAERSLEEMKKQGLGSAAQHAQWLTVMQETFPDVAANDRLRGVHLPGIGVRFYLNGQLIRSIDDPEFSKAFFSIWLSPKTSEPSLRANLLGPAAPPLK
jgi:hypothetical protein